MLCLPLALIPKMTLNGLTRRVLAAKFLQSTNWSETIMGFYFPLNATLSKTNVGVCMLE